MRSTSILLSVILLSATGSFTACQTNSPGVKSSYHSQWTSVESDTVKATDAAKDALKELKLEDVQSKSTAVDGYAIGYTADKKKITVDVRRVNDKTSEVSVNVGTMGDPELGKDILSHIRKNLGDK